MTIRACFFPRIQGIPYWGIPEFQKIEKFLDAPFYFSNHKFHQKAKGLDSEFQKLFETFYVDGVLKCL